MALWALGNTYAQDVVFSGPAPLYSMFSNDTFAVSYKRGNGKGAEGRLTGLHLWDLKSRVVTPQFHPASAKISGLMVELRSDKVPDPEYARYAWKPYPDQKLNLVNGAGLPAVPFTWYPDYLRQASN